jgi:hypothetical protein
MVTAVLLAGLASGDMALPALAEPAGKPLLSGMQDENEPAVQHVRDALTVYNGANKRWPANLDELSAFAQKYKLPLDLAAFSKATYSVQNKGAASVAVFEFVVKSSAAKGAFAISEYIVK